MVGERLYVKLVYVCLTVSVGLCLAQKFSENDNSKLDYFLSLSTAPLTRSLSLTVHVGLSENHVISLRVCFTHSVQAFPASLSLAHTCAHSDS